MVGYKKCCKPFPELKCSKNLRNVNDYIKIRLPRSIHVTTNSSICTSCYYQVTNKRQKVENEVSPVNNSLNSPVTPETSSTVNDENISSMSESEECQIKSALVREKLNKILPDIGMSPIYPSKLESRQYHEQKKLLNLTTTLPTSSTSLVSGLEPLLTHSEENHLTV